MKIAATLIALLSIFAGSSVVYAEQAVDSLRNIATTDASDLPDHFVPKPVTSITPGLVIYTTEGERLGAVRAIIHKDGVAKRIYIGTEEYPAATITLKDGRAIYTA